MPQAFHGHHGCGHAFAPSTVAGLDIHDPFLVWLGRAKTARYTDAALASTREQCERVVDSVRRNLIHPAETPPIYNIDRWWNPGELAFLCKLRAGIEAESENQSPERDLLLMA